MGSAIARVFPVAAVLPLPLGVVFGRSTPEKEFLAENVVVVVKRPVSGLEMAR